MFLLFVIYLTLSRTVNTEDIPIRNNSEFPFIAGIFTTNKEGIDFACNGIILAPEYVLTVASCLLNFHESRFANYSIFSVTAGSVYLLKGERVELRASEWFVHPGYEPRDYLNRCVHSHNVAILKLEEKLNFTTELNKVDLPAFTNVTDRSNFSSSETTGRINDKEDCYVTHFGTDVGREVYPAIGELRRSEAVLVDVKSCVEHLQAKSKPMFTSNADLCRSDQICSKSVPSGMHKCPRSGSALMCGNKIIGIGFEQSICTGDDLLVLYTRLDTNMDWIKSVSSTESYHQVMMQLFLFVDLIWLIK